VPAGGPRVFAGSRERWSGGAAGGLQALEPVGRGVVPALAEIHRVMQAVEGAPANRKGAPEGIFLIRREGGQRILPDLSFDSGENALLPMGADQDVDELTLLPGGGAKLGEVFVREGFEFLLVLGAGQVELQVNAG